MPQVLDAKNYIEQNILSIEEDALFNIAHRLVPHYIKKIDIKKIYQEFFSKKPDLLRNNFSKSDMRQNEKERLK
jgi:hypothetical protein